MAAERWVSFDCYGTLIDWERGIADAMRGLWPDADTRTLLARYHELEPRIQAGSDATYREVLTAVLREIAASERLPLTEEDAGTLARTLPEWPPFAEAPDELAELRRRGLRLAILSNTDPDLLAGSIGRLGVEIDLTVTVAEAGSYKPAHGHWRTFFDRTGAGHERHVHVAASLFHDIAPARELDLHRIWINRNDERTDLAVDAVLPDLRGLADVVDEVIPA